MLGAVVASPVLSGARPVSAQQAQQVEEITITAQKREEPLQTAPLSVTALTETDLLRAQIDTPNEIGKLAPNVTMHRNAGGNTGTSINIRGAITNDPIITLEPAVGIYVDEVYIAKNVGSMFDMPDIERIEVLRGPQGTLFGRNTIGGAINIVTKKPSDELEARLLTRVGNFNSIRTAATFNVPLLGETGLTAWDGIGTLNARGTVQYRYRDGIYDNQGSGSKDFDDLNRIAARGALRWRPIERVTVDYEFDFHRSREDTTAFQLTGVRPTSPVQFALGPAGFEAFKSQARANRASAIRNNSGLRPIRAMERAGETFLDDLENDLDVRGHRIHVTADLGAVGVVDRLTFKSITGFRNMDQFEVQDLDGTDFHVADTALNADHEQITQEAQLVGGRDDGLFNFVLGFYYFTEEGGEVNDQIFNGGTNLATVIISANRFDNWAMAPFGQVTVTPPILDGRLEVTGGVRYTHEEKSHERNFDCVRIPFFVGPDVGFQSVPCDAADFSPNHPDPLIADLSERAEVFTNFSPMGNVSLRLTDEAMVYVRIARGFKSGGFNGRATDPVSFAKKFDPEKLTSYEWGFKSQWLENRARLDASAFFNDYSDLQVSVFRASEGGGAATTVENAADAQIWGAEVEGLAVPIAGLQLRAAYSLLLPEYKEFLEQKRDENGNPVLDEQGNPVLEDVSDDRVFVMSPKHTVTAGISYTRPLSRIGVLSASLDAYYQDNVNFLVENNDIMRQNGYVLVDARLGLGQIPLQEGFLDLALWARNIFDRKYRDFGIDFGQFGYAGNTYGEPRMFGLEAVYRWGGSA